MCIKYMLSLEELEMSNLILFAATTLWAGRPISCDVCAAAGSLK